MRDAAMLRPIDLARDVGLSVQAIRHYEALGFLPVAMRTATGHRRYQQRHLVALRVSRALIAGYSWPTALRIMQHIQAGNLDGALVEVDAHHATLHARRQHAEATLAALRMATIAQVNGSGWHSMGRDHILTIGAAAQSVGVRVSALRFWETQGVLRPRRHPTSNYRFYDASQLQVLRVVALLRAAGYSFESIHEVLVELEAGRPEAAIAAAEQRLADLARLSRRCVEALALLWTYVTEHCK